MEANRQTNINKLVRKKMERKKMKKTKKEKEMRYKSYSLLGNMSNKVCFRHLFLFVSS